MLRAIELAKKGTGFTNPNPLVGAVIVKDNRIIGEGYHEKYGQLHAERNAIASLTESAEGATIYVTLEPCCHYGKTPPCTEAIIENKITKVVIGSRDPNPLVSGKGAQILREHGIEVIEDFMREECDSMNEIFFHFITTKTPYCVMKYAMTADGKIATHTGASKWITGEVARNKVQHMRHRYAGIMAGIQTVLEDNPMLNVRVDGLTSPVRIICDSRLRISPDCNICNTADTYRTIIVCSNSKLSNGSITKDTDIEDQAFGEKVSNLLEKNLEIYNAAGKDERVDLKVLMEYLGSEKIDSVLIEGGGTLNESALKAGIVNEIKAFVAPKIFGGTNVTTPVQGDGVETPDEAYMLELKNVEYVGEDLLLTYLRKEH